jgi:hypothetical protein
LKSVDSHDSIKLHFKQQHAMLIYHTDEKDADTKYVNEALKKAYLTIYLPINGANNNNGASSLSKIALSESIDYEENMNRGNF